MSDGESGDGGELIEMLFEAIEEDDEEAVEEALEEGAEVDSLNEDGYTPLIFAAESGSATACEVLLVNDADPNDQMEENGYTALHAAAASNESDIVEMLLESEADPSVKDNEGNTALQVAQNAGNSECEELLADAGGGDDGGDGDGGDDAGTAASGGGDDGFGGGFGDDAGFGGGGFGGNSVTLIAVPGGGWGLTLVGPSAGDGRSGVYVSKVKAASPAATEGSLQPGCKITAIDGEMLDMAMTRKDAVGMIKMAGEQLQIDFEMDEEGFKQYADAKASGPVSNEFSGPVHAVELGMTVGGVGVIMVGPQNPKEFKKGVFVKGAADLSSAYASGKICPGQRIHAINGKSVAGMVIGAVNRMAQQAMNNMVVFQLQYDPIGFAAYDGGKEVNRRKAHGPPEQEAGNMQVGGGNQGGSGSAALRMLPSDKWFFGKVPKTIIVEALIQQGPGTFAIRTMPKNPEGAVVLMINDNNNVVSFVITFAPDGSCTFAKTKHPDIDAVVELVQGSPMTSKNGGEPFVATYPLKGGLEFNFYAFSQGQMPTPQIGGRPPPPQQQRQQGGAPAPRQPQITQKQSIKIAKASAKAAQKERKRSIKVAKKQEKAAKRAGKDYEKTAESWVPPTYPVERLAIAKRDNATFGMTFIGPEPGKSVTGVYITKIKPDGPTDQQSDGKVKRGCKILMMNGLSMATAMKSEATGSLKGAVTAVITYQFDPVGFAQYDGGALIKSIQEEALGKAPVLEDFGAESGFGDDF